MPISSDTAVPAVGSLTASPNMLPVQGFTADQLKDYILRQLGSPTWDVELTPQQILDVIMDALGQFSQWCPRIKYGSLQLHSAQTEYLKDSPDVGMGIVDVSFVEPNPVPTEIFYGNLIDPTPLFRTGLDEYDTFLRWRKTWMRVTSVQPQWLWDTERNCLYIHNPIERFYAGITAYMAYTDTKNLPHHGAQWVKDYSLAKCRYLLGEILSRFSGAIPGPVKDLQLDTQLRDRAEKQIDALLVQLKGMQTFAPIQID
jgi:hypothetical protein